MTVTTRTSSTLPWMTAASALLERVSETQADAIETASQWSAEAIAADGLVHLFGTGHSRIPVEDGRGGRHPGQAGGRRHRHARPTVAGCWSASQWPLRIER